MCSPEVPDLEESVFSAFEGEDLVAWLVNPEEDLAVVREFVTEGEVARPVLLDPEGELYALYPHEPGVPPFPVHVVIDREGVVRHLARTYDAVALREAIAEALAR